MLNRDAVRRALVSHLALMATAQHAKACKPTRDVFPALSPKEIHDVLFGDVIATPGGGADGNCMGKVESFDERVARRAEEIMQDYAEAGRAISKWDAWAQAEADVDDHEEDT